MRKTVSRVFGFLLGAGVFMAAFCLLTATAFAQVPELPCTVPDIDVTQYTYEVTPILTPYCYYVYVKTDNPDPTSFCLSDKDSKYWSQDGYYGSVPQCVWSIFNWEDKIDTFADVVYEDEIGRAHV